MGLNIDMIVVSMTRIRAYRACATSDPSFPVLASFRFVDIVYILYSNVRKWYTILYLQKDECVTILGLIYPTTIMLYMVHDLADMTILLHYDELQLKRL